LSLCQPGCVGTRENLAQIAAGEPQRRNRGRRRRASAGERKIGARTSEGEGAKMASSLLRTSRCRGSTFRRLISAAAAAAPSGGEGLIVRRAVSLRRGLCSNAGGDQPPKSPDEKVIELVEEIVVTRSLPQHVVEQIFESAIDARREAHMKELSKYLRRSFVIFAGGLGGYAMERSAH
ncbi:unnamed protein product, partial [Urochloa humidicola]